MKFKWLALVLSFAPAVSLLYLIRFHVFGLPTTFLEIWILLCLVWATIEGGFRFWLEAWRKERVWRWILLAWGTVTLVAVAWSVAPMAGLGLWRAYVLEPMLVFILLRHALQEKDVERMKVVAWWTAIALTSIGVAQFVTGYGIPHPWNVAIGAGRRAVGIFGYPNALALWLAPVGAWAWATFLRSRNRLAFVTFVATWIGIAVAKSQGGALALGIVTLIGAWNIVAWRKKVIGICIAGALIIGSVPALRTYALREIMFQGWSGQVRMYMWKDTTRMLANHPFTGAGFGGYPTLFAKYQSTTGIEIFQYPHNILLNMWSETGVFGVLVFGWICFMWIRNVRDPLLILPLIAILIHGLVDVPYFKNDLALLFWILLALSIHTNPPPL